MYASTVGGGAMTIVFRDDEILQDNYPVIVSPSAAASR